MADYNSSLPVVGSQYITNPSEIGSIAVQEISGTVNLGTAWTGIGSVLVTNEISVTAGSETWIKGGSIQTYDPIGIGSVLVTNDVNVTQGTDPWTATISGTTTVAGSINIATDLSTIGSIAVQTISGTVEIGTNPVPISGIVNIGVGSISIANFEALGSSVVVTNTVNVAEGARENTVQDYYSGVAIAAGGSDIHFYTSTGSFYLQKVEASASGKLKIIIGTGSPSVTHKAVGFNSTATPNVDIDFGANAIFVGSESIVSIVRVNREATSAQDLYSTIIGYTN
jgi:hypothetical protein